MTCRLVHLGGRPLPELAGSTGSSVAHCLSVRSCRLVAATLGTRSPEGSRFAWSQPDLPETSTFIDHRHAGTSPQADRYQTRPRPGYLRMRRPCMPPSTAREV